MSNKENNNPRKTSDILLSLEEKVLMLSKNISVHDMNMKLILDRLNKLLAQENQSAIKPVEEPKIYSISPSAEISQTPLIPRKQSPGFLAQTNYFPDTEEISKPNIAEVVKKETSKKTAVKQEASNKDIKQHRIPVGQKVSDQHNKDIFMADVVIIDLETQEVLFKLKTSAHGKWQTFLPTGKFKVKITKIIDPNTLNKIEYVHDFEVTNGIKSLLLPVALINR